ncbi:N-acyl-D-amino-acid deacylase family protein [Tautonia plasticadhaerens]|uniref:D-aminoacylase n=1 Tax=Tautonia plasticadhaerens TaxID=2527974 RepID=A0A518H359_9BACT|nr:D-aminoacylase [Tautonia plasticadhaerens]QDV35273.1 D-aminoacylase [Tautonia plasticadhaerens]
MTIRQSHLCLFALIASLTPAPAVASQEGDPGPYDLVIRGGRIVDGTGNPWYFGDLAIRGDRIAAVGRIPEDAEAERTIDATGMVVAPGFVDMHSHSDRVLFEDGAAESKLYQGVTTDVLGEHTSGGPLAEPTEETIGGETVRIESLGDYLDAVERSGIGINVASYVGLGNVWGGVMGDSFDRPTEEQFREMEDLLDAAMADGALGLSTMLAHPQALGVTTDDLVRLCEVVARHGGLYSSHIRSEGEDVLEAIGEAIAVGERAGVPVDIIHIKIADQALWGRMAEIVALIDAARARGVDVQANVYPYTRGNNDLVSIIPPWAHEGGTEALLARLADPEARARMKRDIRSGLPGWYNHFLAVGGDWSRMLISARLTPEHAGLEGKTMDVILPALAGDRQPPPDDLDLLFDFLLAEGGSIGTIYAHHTEEDMNLALVQPWCSIGSDGSALATSGPLRSGHPHPRNFGTFPRVLGLYVRDRGLLGLEEAVRKMTSQNATKAGLDDRGLLRPGSIADVVVLDPARIIDRSTFLEPFRYSEGISTVVVNGRVALDSGAPTGIRAGRSLRRGR